MASWQGRALTSSVRSVITFPILTQGADLSHLLRGELDLPEVVLDTRGSNRLGDDTVTSNLGPGKAEKERVLARRIIIIHG